jgi:sarcosine oxidase subunit gamma
MSDRVTIDEVPAMARFSLRLRTAVPDLPGLQATAPFGDGDALGLGPDEWLLLLPVDASPPLFSGPHSLTDVSARSIALYVEGAGAEGLLQTGCPLDLVRFHPGRVTRTLFETIEIVLWRQTQKRFHVEVWRSFGDYLCTALMLAAEDRPSVLSSVSAS